MSDSIYLSIRNLRKVYQDDKVALQDFNWDLSNGVYGLLGPNGAGKSTLLEILSLNLMPTSGKILWEGWDIQKRPHAFRRIIGYLPQSYGFYAELKAVHMLGYLGRLSGLRGRELKQRLDEVLEIVGLTGVKKRKIKGFSGGMLQRLALAQSLIHSPRLLIVDEPTTGLDPGERVAFRNLLFDLGRTCIVLLSTHIVKDVEFSCHQMTVLYGGTQHFTGVPVDFIGRVGSRVYEEKIPFRNLDEFSERHRVISIQESGEDVKVRFIAYPGENEVKSTRLVKANLEDAYVDFIREREEEELEAEKEMLEV
jgi:ABC-2 type transport system ATP-binding protein